MGALVWAQRKPGGIEATEEDLGLRAGKSAECSTKVLELNFLGEMTWQTFSSWKIRL
jgi:hypothetical protein